MQFIYKPEHKHMETNVLYARKHTHKASIYAYTIKEAGSTMCETLYLYFTVVVVDVLIKVPCGNRT